MSDAESWEKYGFPDPRFHQGYLPYVGLCKAYTERAKAVNEHAGEYPYPDYFTRINPGNNTYYFFNNFDQSLYGFCRNFVNPDKITGASSYSQCFWTFEDLLLAAAGGVESEILWTFYDVNPLMVQFPAKWAIQRHNAINLLRYVPTKYLTEWPFVEYEDRNDTFNFKAQEAQ